MKKLKYSKKMLLDAKAFLKNTEKYYHKINKEYSQNILKLLESISIGENLDFEMLKNKYLKSSDNIDKTLTPTTEESPPELTEEQTTEENIIQDCKILDKITIDGSNYYYENKENGCIYDSDSKIVGYYNNKKFILNN